ncbi:short-chain dehydrogenase [Formosimonas limnophila]|uniref:Short-chain dehydrogenase n=1 Tax=Formosimonas limnophila TaxID=1384487 RepID=A0A8J3CKD6_9BURK|nr:SDR family NAD(P)-dependent oxidoreductase [Formosimonas limnophila]GHA68914.1 short-chain dehydrogenase [Formosimonas limnophila]
MNTPRRIWLTGASSGIGAALAHALLKQGHQLALTARNQVLLQSIADAHPQQVLVLPADLTDATQVAQVAQSIQTHWGTLDTVILNAGTCEYIDVANFEAAMIQRVINTNLIATAQCIEAALPLLRQGVSPHLVGTSSSVVFLPLPRAGAYGASKAAMTYLFNSLRIDLAHENIAVTLIHPGFVDTPLTQKNDFSMPMRWGSTKAASYIADKLVKRPFEINFPRAFIWFLKTCARLPKSWQFALTKQLKK